MYKIFRKKNGKFVATDGTEFQEFDSVLHASPWLINLAAVKHDKEITLFDITIEEE